MDKAKILVVDDEPMNIDVLSELLKDEHALQIAPTRKKELEIAFSDDVSMIGVSVR